MTFAVITGTRPEIIKMYPLMKLFDSKGVDYRLIHTGQHYDYGLSLKFVEEFKIRKPDYNISLSSSTAVNQVGEIMYNLGNILLQLKPSLVLVQGDTNSVVAGALSALKCNIPIAHLESGLRCDDWRMAEEHNRRLVDHISDILFATTIEAASNLKNEQVHGDMHVVGNTVIDAIKLCLEGNMNRRSNENILHIIAYDNTSRRQRSKIFDMNDFALVTMHRPENVDNNEFMKEMLVALSISGLNYIFPIHPRTLKQIRQLGLGSRIPNTIRLTEPLGYFDFLNLLKEVSICNY